MRKNIIIYFVLFGFLLGLINAIDTTGGDIPYSMMLNVPTLYAQGIVDNLFDKVERARFNEVSERIGVSPQPPTLSRDEFEKLSPEKQGEFVSQMTRQKDSVRNDPVIGEKGRLLAIRGFISFPVLSAFTWGLIGIAIYIIILVKKKFNNTEV